jgi:acyl-CoA thioester hydrolase
VVFGKFDEATWHLFNLLECTPSYMTLNNRGMVAVEQHLTYKKRVACGKPPSFRSGILE